MHPGEGVNEAQCEFHLNQTKDNKMAQNTKPAAQKPEDPTVAKKSSKKLVLGIVASLVLVIAAGAGWYFTKGKDDAQQVEEVKVVPPKTPIFVALEPFTVNLQREVNDQYLQMGITLKLFESEFEAKIKASLPEIRSKILQLLTTKTATELLTAEGKTQLVKEILALSNSVIGIVTHPAPTIVPGAAAADLAASAPAPASASAPAAAKPVEPKGVVDVLFTSFIIQ